MSIDQITEGKLIAGRWRVVAELEETDYPRFRVQDQQGWDGEMLIIDGVQDISGKVHSLRDLKHENVILQVEAGSWAGMNYLVRELITGQSIKDWLLRDGKLTYEQTLGIACQICLAGTELAKYEIHALAINPETIIVDPKGFVKIDPLGVGKSASDTYYKAPEEHSGSKADHKSDIFRLGMLIYVMLTGGPPRVDGHGTPRPEDLHVKDPTIPEELSRTVERMMAVHPGHRQENMEAVLDELHSLLMHKPPLSAASGMKPQWYEDKRFWLYIGFGLLALVVLISLITGIFPFITP